MCVEMTMMGQHYFTGFIIPDIMKKGNNKRLQGELGKGLGLIRSAPRSVAASPISILALIKNGL